MMGMLDYNSDADDDDAEDDDSEDGDAGDDDEQTQMEIVDDDNALISVSE